MTSTVRYVAYGILIVFALVIVAVFTVLAVTYFVRRRRSRQSVGARRLHSQYSYISPLEHPPFVIPPYLTEEDVFESGSESSLSIIQEEETSIGKHDCDSPVSHSPLGTPTITRPQFQRSVSELDNRYSRERTRPKYRRTTSTLGGSLSHQPVKRKTSFGPPRGKIQASIHYVTDTSLLVVQVNGMYDLPQLRTSGISTPYVRVNLISGDEEKDMRTNFMNLSTNRICVFDRMSLDEAKESTLKFVVLDYDKFSRSEFVAELSVPLNEINVEEGETILRKLASQTLPEMDRALGTVTVSLCQEPREGRIVVHVIKAENLPTHKADDILDSYVRVTYQVQNKQVDRRKTKVVKRTISPVFNDLFFFEMKEEELTHSSVVCEVFQSDFKTEKIGHINLGIGQNSIGSEVRHWNEMMASPQKQIIQCHNLRT